MPSDQSLDFVEEQEIMERLLLLIYGSDGLPHVKFKNTQISPNNENTD